jgi:hypothetical protein
MPALEEVEARRTYELRKYSELAGVETVLINLLMRLDESHQESVFKAISPEMVRVLDDDSGDTPAAIADRLVPAEIDLDQDPDFNRAFETSAAISTWILAWLASEEGREAIHDELRRMVKTPALAG